MQSIVFVQYDDIKSGRRFHGRKKKLSYVSRTKNHNHPVYRAYGVREVRWLGFSYRVDVWHEQLPFQRRRRLRVLSERRRRHSQPRHGHAARPRDFGVLVMVDRHSCNPTIRGRYNRGVITATRSTLLFRTPAFSALTVFGIMLLASHALVQHRIDDDLFDVCRQTKFARPHRYQLELQQGIDERHPIARPGDPASGPCNKQSKTTAGFHLIFWVTNRILYVAVHVS